MPVCDTTPGVFVADISHMTCSAWAIGDLVLEGISLAVLFSVMTLYDNYFKKL